jgi:hypothetical protein
MPMKTSISDGTSNRVADAIFLYAEQEAQLYISNPLEGRYDLHAVDLKLQYLTSVYNTFRKNPTPDEKHSLRYLRHEIAKMRTRLKPTTLNKVFYSRIANSIRNFMNGYNLIYAKHNKAIKKLQQDIIQAHNLHNLSASMKKAGFNIEVEGTLKKLIDHDLPVFHIRYADPHYLKADFVLHFKKIPQTDLYYFEKFEAISRPTLDSLLKNDPSCIRYTFSLQDQMRFSAGEACNLVNGKCVCKLADGKETWLLLDTANLYSQHSLKSIPFNLEKTLQKLPLKLNSSQYQALLQTLKTGNGKEVNFSINNNTVKYTVEAAPLRKTIDVLDKNDQLVDISKILNGHSNKLTQQVMEKINQQSSEEIDLGEVSKAKVRIR